MSERAKDPGEMRLHGFVSKPEIQKLNRNSIFVFVNGRLIRDRLVQHALTEAYRNIIPPTVYPVVLLFLELPAAEVDVNVHPSKTEVRFRQQTVMHDFVRDSVRAALMKARPVPQFVTEIRAHATASQALTPGADGRYGGNRRWKNLHFCAKEATGMGRDDPMVRRRRICIAGARFAADFGALAIRRRNRSRGQCGDPGRPWTGICCARSRISRHNFLVSIDAFPIMDVLRHSTSAKKSRLSRLWAR